MNNHAVVYEISTGRIFQNMSVPASIDLSVDYLPPEGHALLLGVLADDVDAFKVQDGVLVPIGKQGPDIDAEKRSACYEIDTVAGYIRGRMTSVGKALDMTYQLKEARAKLVLEQQAAHEVDPLGVPAPDPVDFPLLAPEIGVTAPDLVSLAQTIINKAAAWEQAAGLIEGARLAGKKAVSEASTIAEIEAAYEAATIALNQLTQHME